MGKLEELLKSERLIKDLELRLNTYKYQVDVIQKELNFLETLEEQLEGNIKQLKKINVVALAAEYKKAKDDLKKTKTRLSFLKTDKTTNEKAYKETLNILDKTKETHKKLSKEGENNVISGKFGKKSD